MIECIGYLASFLLVFCTIPQIVKTYQTKTIAGLSLPMLLMWWTGCALYLIYVLLTAPRWPLILNYSVDTVLISFILVLYWRFKPKKDKMDSIINLWRKVNKPKLDEYTIVNSTWCLDDRYDEDEKYG